MRADDLTVVRASARGRDSIRITSQATYEDSIIVLDLQHMPEGCATWPAFWTLSKAGPWPRTSFTSAIVIRTTYRNLVTRWRRN